MIFQRLIIFKDITTLLNKKKHWKSSTNHLEQRYKSYNLDYIAGIYSRGFIFGAALADRLGVGFFYLYEKKENFQVQQFVRNMNLRWIDEVEVHLDAFNNEKNVKVLLIDDIIVSGGTNSSC